MKKSQCSKNLLNFGHNLNIENECKYIFPMNTKIVCWVKIAVYVMSSFWGTGKKEDISICWKSACDWNQMKFKCNLFLKKKKTEFNLIRSHFDSQQIELWFSFFIYFLSSECVCVQRNSGDSLDGFFQCFKQFLILLNR